MWEQGGGIERELSNWERRRKDFIEVGISFNRGRVGLLIFRRRVGLISLGSGIWKEEEGGDWLGVMSKGNSVSESGRVREVWVCWGTEVLGGVWVGVLTGVVSKEGVIGIGFKGGCWDDTEVCEEGIMSVETVEEVREEESDKNTVRSRMETKGKNKFLRLLLNRRGWKDISIGSRDNNEGIKGKELKIRFCMLMVCVWQQVLIKAIVLMKATVQLVFLR